MEKKEFFFILGLISTTFFLHLYDFGLPPLQGDELVYFSTSLTMITSPDSELYKFSETWGLRIGKFPVQFSPYLGGVSSYLSIPTLFFLGINPESVRIYQMIIAASIVVLTYFTGKELFSKRVGVISSSLLVVFPVFVFFSRQGSMYDISLISIGLLIIILSTRYLKTLSLRYLFGSLFLIGIGVWGHLWFLWFVLGIIVTIPLFINKINPKLNEHKILKNSQNQTSKIVQRKHGNITLIFLSAGSLVLGFFPLILSHMVNWRGGVISFLIDTVFNKTSYLNPVVSNSDFIGNFFARIEHFFQILATPGLGLAHAALDSKNTWGDTYYLLPVIFLISLAVIILHIVYRKPKSRRIIGLSLLILTILVTSSFTVTSFNTTQLTLLHPFIFLFIGTGITIIAENNKTKKLFPFFKRKDISNYIIIGIVVPLILFQIPLLITGYEKLENSTTSSAKMVFDDIKSYVKENDLSVVSNGFSIYTPIVFYTDGEIIPKRLLHGYSGSPTEFDEESKKTLLDLEVIYLDNQHLFLVEIYPEIPDCTESILTPHQVYYMCIPMYIVELAAERNNKNLEIIDFKLDDGTPYIRGMRLLDNN